MAKLLAIALSPEKGTPPTEVDTVLAVAGKGLTGDRYFETKPKKQATLIEKEALDALARDYQMQFSHIESARNLLVEGVALNHFVGVEFQVGSVRMRGTELCEPCGTLERRTEKEGVKAALRHRGGLRVEILEGGTLTPGDEITWS